MSMTESEQGTCFLVIKPTGAETLRELLPQVAGKAYRVVTWLLCGSADTQMKFQASLGEGKMYTEVDLTGIINIGDGKVVGQVAPNDRGLFQTLRGYNLQMAFDVETASEGYLVYLEV
jgi:hypothetical protein